MAMNDLLKNMWIMKAITPARLDNAVVRRYITEDQKAEILATPQVDADAV